MWYSSSSGRIELNIPLRVAHIGSRPGKCDDDIRWIMHNEPKVMRQLRKVDPELLKAELDEFGCWSEEELRDHQVNLERLLWVACGDIVEEAWRKKHG